MAARDDHTEMDLCDDESLNSSREVREACAIQSAIELGYIDSIDELSEVSWGGMSTTGLAQKVIYADSMKNIDNFARKMHAKMKDDDVINVARILDNISNDPGSEYWNGTPMAELLYKINSSSEMSPT